MHLKSNLHKDYQQMAQLSASPIAMHVLLSIMHTSHMMLNTQQELIARERPTTKNSKQATM